MDALMHENGVWYRELFIDGLKDRVKLFNSLRPERLEGETVTEYKIRRKFLKHKESSTFLFHNPYENGVKGVTKGKPYINPNKKDKFKKK